MTQELEGPMMECFQFQSVSVLQHGLDVHGWYAELRDHLLDGIPLERAWVLPSWVDSPVVRAELSSADPQAVRLYQTYHDCGKPLCRTVDSDGRQHFPDHAVVSKRRWLECGGSREVAELIGMDMDAHLLRPDGVAEFAARPQAIVLLVTALCELHSNAAMFGGTSSEGFRIKHKRLSKMGERVLRIRSSAVERPA